MGAQRWVGLDPIPTSRWFLVYRGHRQWAGASAQQKQCCYPARLGHSSQREDSNPAPENMLRGERGRPEFWVFSWEQGGGLTVSEAGGSQSTCHRRELGGGTCRHDSPPRCAIEELRRGQEGDTGPEVRGAGMVAEAMSTQNEVCVEWDESAEGCVPTTPTIKSEQSRRSRTRAWQGWPGRQGKVRG